MGHEKVPQMKLGRPQMNGRIPGGYALADRIRTRACLRYGSVFRSGLTAAQDGAHAGDQLG